jgi:acetyltransferase-like isoleucine patch superfamily enzyme
LQPEFLNIPLIEKKPIVKIPTTKKARPPRKNASPDLNILFIGSQKPCLDIGAHSYINGMRLYCWDQNIKLKIGKFCSFADDVIIIAGGEHDKDWVSTYPFIDRWKLDQFKHLKKSRYKGDIVIGNDVWVAHGATILSGVQIGDGAIIGAGAIVTKDVQPYSIVVGNPAKVIKYRFEKKVIESLLAIKWWDWDEGFIAKNQELFVDPERFVRKFKK